MAQNGGRSSPQQAPNAPRASGFGASPRQPSPQQQQQPGALSPTTARNMAAAIAQRSHGGNTVAAMRQYASLAAQHQHQLQQHLARVGGTPIQSYAPQLAQSMPQQPQAGLRRHAPSMPLSSSSPPRQPLALPTSQHHPRPQPQAQPHSQQQNRPQPTAPTATEILLETLSVAGVAVQKVQRGHQILYKLANPQAANRLSQQQRQFIANEIMRMHAREAQQSLPNSATTASHHSQQSAAQRQQRQPQFQEADYNQLKRDIDNVLTELRTRKKLAISLARDQRSVHTPDVKSPFKSLRDAADRLLPYHIYQYPDIDLSSIAIDLKPGVTKFDQEATRVCERIAALGKRISEQPADPELAVLCDRLLTDDENALMQKLRTGYNNFLSAITARSYGQLPHTSLQAEHARMMMSASSSSAASTSSPLQRPPNYGLPLRRAAGQVAARSNSTHYQTARPVVPHGSTSPSRTSPEQHSLHQQTLPENSINAKMAPVGQSHIDITSRDDYSTPGDPGGNSVEQDSGSSDGAVNDQELSDQDDEDANENTMSVSASTDSRDGTEGAEDDYEDDDEDEEDEYEESAVS